MQKGTVYEHSTQIVDSIANGELFLLIETVPAAREGMASPQCSCAQGSKRGKALPEVYLVRGMRLRVPRIQDIMFAQET